MKPHSKDSITPLAIREKTISSTILSLSGWRKIFSSDGKANSMNSDISKIDLEFLLAAADVLCEYFIEQNYSTILLGQDSRPTGETIKKILYKVIPKNRITCDWSEPTALPEVMAYCEQASKKTGLIYITASHNPSGYNGLKIGDFHGKVMEEKVITMLIEKLKKLYLNDEEMLILVKKYNSINTSLLDDNLIFPPPVDCKSAYYQFTERVIAGEQANNVKDMRSALLLSLKQCISSYRPIIIYDFNGSARIGSIDLGIIEDFGVVPKIMGERIGEFNHGIVPEGNNLNCLKSELLKFQSEKSIFGLAVDCDGDRGNLVLWDKNDDVFVPDAQSTFLLSVISQLAFLSLFYPQHLMKAAVVGNGPTSQRIAKICKSFEVEFFQAEVGEANILALAENLKSHGYSIPILGEGSNGGNITPPSNVRDPLNTVFAVLKMLFLKSEKSSKSLLDVVRDKFKVGEKIIGNDPRYALYEIVTCGSVHHTTPSFSSEGIIQVQSCKVGNLKEEYEKLFVSNFNPSNPTFKRLGVRDYQIVNYEGIHSRVGQGNRTGAEDGGFKIRLMNKKDEVAFMWFRNSKTEPVFRVVVDVKGKIKDHDELLVWHKKLISKSDTISCQR